VLSGSLPDGLDLDPATGVISGSPTVADSFDFTVRVTDSSNPSKQDDQELFIVVGTQASGDVNLDGQVNLEDALYILNYLFKDGPAPSPMEIADVNCDEEVNLGDALHLLNYLFKGDDPPC
jgi:hypothetical protein